MLRDPDHDVRALAAEGTCQIMSTFWEMIPGEITKDLINVITTELVWDQSWTGVRLAAITVSLYESI